METIAEFCERHDSCFEGRDWAIANCRDGAEAWDKLPGEWFVWLATREGVLDNRTLRRFGCWSVRQIWHLLTDERSRNAVEVAERHADGNATDEELAAARAAQAKWLRENVPNPFVEVCAMEESGGL